MTKHAHQWRTVFATAGLVVLFLLGLGIRRAVLDAQVAAGQPILPFTLESALQFRRTAMVVAEGRLPVVDTAVEYPNGVRVARTYTIGSEYVYAWLSRLLFAVDGLESRLRWLEAGCFCLGIPLLALWIGLWLRSMFAGAISGAYYAVSLASVIRSTGQELSRENAALPQVILFFVLDQLAERAKGRWTYWLFAALAGVVLATAAMSWDLVQYVVLLWGVFAAYRAIRPRSSVEDPWRAKWAVQFAPLVIAGLLNPYLHAHAFLASPAMLLGYGVVLAMAAGGWLRRFMPRGELYRLFALIVLLVAPAAVMLLWGEAYRGHYGHFGELLWAKLRFLNQKPADPARLSFNARIMWVPALHSADWALTLRLFPASLLLTILAGTVLSYRPQSLESPFLYQLIFFSAASLLTYCLFVRFHVFLALFSAALIGVWAHWARLRGGWPRVTVIVLLVLGLVVEGGHVLKRPERWGRTDVYYGELKELTDWLRRLEEPAPVLANFGVSSSILAYGHCPIVLHPKFESPGIRERVREYGEALFSKTDREFRDWADQFGARYYVYSLGEFSAAEPRWQMRYFVNALDPPAYAVARQFEWQPETSRYFQLVWGNRKYRVFRILSRAEESRADGERQGALAAFQRGDLDQAKEGALAVLAVSPEDQEMTELLGHIYALQNEGFSYRPEEER